MAIRLSDLTNFPSRTAGYIRSKFNFIGYLILVLGVNLRWLVFRIAPRFGNKPMVPVVIVLSSIPSRFTFLEKTLKTLLLQDNCATTIRVYIENKDFKKIPVSAFKLISFGVEFIRVESGLGSATKLLPEITLNSSPNYILYLDDDHIYPKNLLRNMYQQALRNSEIGVICNRHVSITMGQRTIEPYTMWERHNSFGLLRNRDIPLGYAGVMVRRDLMPKSILNYEKYQECCFNGDDFWFWANFLENNLKIIGTGLRRLKLITWRNSQENALYKVNALLNRNNMFLNALSASYHSVEEVVRELETEVLLNKSEN
jgi:hypothetical protein